MNQITFGIVKWFHTGKGFGFIVHKDKDVFVHYKSIIGDGFKTLLERDKVEFEILNTDKGPQAINVHKLK